jgi:uncharacterized surface protein with fasciclin (FAS1) repeats
MMRSRPHLRLAVLALAVAAAAVPVGCGSGDDAATSPPPEPAVTPTIVPTPTTGDAMDALGEGDLATLAQLIVAAGLQRDLAEAAPFTLFAPSDDAFASLPLGQLRENRDELRGVVQYHVIPDQNVELASISSGDTFRTAQGESVTITFADGATMVDKATVVAAFAGADWTIYVIDTVLLPPVAEER